MAFPLNSKPDWRHPPWITLLLILINCLVFFGPQHSDEHRASLAEAAYVAGPLAKIELPHYIDYLERQPDQDQDRLNWLRQALAPDADTDILGFAWRLMERDVRFMSALRAGYIITDNEPVYANWHQARERQDSIRGETFTLKWASNPSSWQPITLLSAMFLHASLMHLLGNMVFLFVFGYTVEMSLGAARYTVFYLLCGVAGDLADLAVRWGDISIGLGASGAISGLMALYAILYGLRKINFFYQFLFYFDYVTAPAIILVPLWIIDQVWLQISQANSGVAYMAHIGGLIGGTLLGAYFKWQRRGTDIVLPEETEKDPFPQAYADAMGLVKAMKMDAARDAFGKLATMRPYERDVLSRYFNLARIKPSDKHFHRAADLIFKLKDNHPQSMELMSNTLKSYLAEARPHPRLAPESLASMAIHMSLEGQVNAAEQVTKILLKLFPQHPQAATVIFSLADMQRRNTNHERSSYWLQMLQERYPNSPEAKLQP